MLKKLALLAVAGLMAFGIGTFTAPSPAEASGRFVYSNNGVYLSFGQRPHRHYRKRYQRRHHYRHAPRHYRHGPRHYAPRRHHRANRYCHRVHRWAVRNTSDPKMQRRILRANGC
jgi:hypothetical protein